MKNNVSTIIAAGKRTMTGQRDADFYRACCRELAASEREGHLHPTVRSLVSATLQSRAPMFYVSYAFALRTLRGMRRHRSGRSYDSRRRKWHDIDLRVAALEHRHRLSDSEALQRVLAEGDAPGFYLSVSAAERIYRQGRRQRRVAQESVFFAEGQSAKAISVPPRAGKAGDCRTRHGAVPTGLV